MPLPYKLGSHGPEIDAWQEWFNRAFASYAPPKDGYYGGDEARAVRELQRRLGLPQTGIFDEVTAAKAKFPGVKAREHRPIWVYTAPGSGVPWWVGPPFDLGEWCKQVLNLNHQPVGYPIGGYLGLMGGDPGLSYNDVINAQGAELERLIAACPDLTNPAVEFWFVGYSQSADGMKRAVERLFGAGGRFERLRPRINGIITFGDPTKPGTGIARLVWTAPDWITKLTHCITNVSPTPDFYAEAADNIRPLFYEWFVRAETELPFVIYTGQIIIPALLNLVAPFLGALTSPLAVPILAGATGIGSDMLGPLIGGVLGSKEKPNPELIKLLSVQGVLTNLPALVGLLGAMPGIAVHGDYHAPKPEFGGRSGFQVGCDVVAGFRR
jgi:peptidoglycan hydrolase-like protein with peptidoglycan-binding domain